MTPRIDHLVDDGLVERSAAQVDGRGVVVVMTQAGLERLLEAMPVHIRRVSELFVDPLDDQELTALQNALGKVTVDCELG